MSGDRLEGLAARLDALDDDVTAHPDVLEDVHRALVDELDALSRATGSKVT